MITIKVEPLTALVAEIFAGVGSSMEEGQRVASSLVGANLAGHDSHGVIRVPRYVAWVESGDIVPNQTVQRLIDAGAADDKTEAEHGSSERAMAKRVSVAHRPRMITRRRRCARTSLR